MATNKKYSAVQVVDPSGDGHLAKVYPGQELKVVLSKETKGVEVFLSSDYLKMKEVATDKNDNTVYTFYQLYDLTSWSKLSATYLGEITLLTKDMVSSVCVMLEGHTFHNQNILTVVNPIGNQIKVEPQQVLEVVIYDEDCLTDDVWDYEIVCGNIGEKIIEYDYIDNEIVYPAVNYKSFMKESETLSDFTLIMPRCVARMPIREYHFFFKVDYNSLSTLQEMENGSYDGGKIYFYPKNKENEDPVFKNSINLNINLRQRNRETVFKGMYFNTNFHVISNSALTESTRIKKQQSSDNTYGLKEQSSTSYNNTTAATTTTRTTYKNTYTYNANKTYASKLTVPDVAVKSKGITKDISDGCRIAYYCKVPGNST